MLSSSIRRIWHGWATAEHADRYEQLLTTSIVPRIVDRQLPGVGPVEVLRSREQEGGLVEFITMMSFADWEAVVAFAGGDGHASVVPDDATRLLHHFDARSRHYDLRQVSGLAAPSARR